MKAQPCSYNSIFQKEEKSLVRMSLSPIHVVTKEEFVI